MKSIKYILLAIAVITFSSCGNIRKISIGKVEYQGIQLKSFTSAIVNIGIEVNNPTKKAILLTDIEGQVCKGGSELAEFNLENEVVVDPGYSGVVTVPLNARIVSLAALYDLPFEQIISNSFNLDLGSIDFNSNTEDVVLPDSTSRNNPADAALTKDSLKQAGKSALNSLMKDLTMPTKITGKFGGVRKTKRFANLLDYMR